MNQEENAMSPLIVYITASDEKEARVIGGILVEKKLAACVNIFPQIQSIYRWEGKVETSSEVVLLVKTSKQLFEQVEKTVCKLHSYNCPCIVSVTPERIHSDYLGWWKEQMDET